MEDNHNKSKNDESIIETAKARFKLGLEADSKNRELAREDMRFRAGDQWPNEVENSRKLDGRPCLTINKIPQNIHQVTNDQRQNRPRIKVSPFDDVADPETSKIYQGLIRNIENNSHADTAYDVAFEQAVTGGRGFFRVSTEYSDPMSFDQDVKIKPVYSLENCVLDPSYKEPDGSDANWAIVFEDISKEDFKAQYPTSKCLDGQFIWDTMDSNWHNDETIRIAEYFFKDFKKDVLYKLPDNSLVLKSELDVFFKNNPEFQFSEDEINSFPSRETQIPIVKHYKINGNEVLDKTEFPSKFIPIIPVHGVELWVEGERVFEGLIRHAKDPQRMYNYWATCETEAIALAPKTPWIGVEGQFEGHEDKWNTAHLKNYAYLEYKSTLLANNQAAPPPQRQFGEPNVQAITQARMLASDDLKSTTGIYDASLGNRSNESSGVAITRRAHQSQTANFHFMDNLSRSIAHCGRILLDVIPKIYDTERVIRIMNPDEEVEIVTINKEFKDDLGNIRKHDFSLGKYDAVVETGPSYSTKRQEAVEAMLSLVASNPQISSIAGDLIVKNMDWSGASDIAERLKRTIDPKILGENQGEIPPEVQAQMEQLQQIVDGLTNQLNQAQEIINDKSIEIESRERIEFAKLENQIRMKEMELALKYNKNMEPIPVLADQAIDLESRQELLNIDNPIEQEKIAENLERDLMNNLPSERTLENPGEMPNGEM